jgi:hypothetical protein
MHFSRILGASFGQLVFNGNKEEVVSTLHYGVNVCLVGFSGCFVTCLVAVFVQIKAW